MSNTNCTQKKNAGLFGTIFEKIFGGNHGSKNKDYGKPISNTNPAYVNGEHVKWGKDFVPKANVNHEEAIKAASASNGEYYEKDGYTYIQ